MIEAPVQTYPRRPDPGEPWRYACPECGSVVVDKRKYVDLSHWPKPGLARGGVERERHRYYCRECETGTDALIDKKSGERCRPGF